MPITTDGYSMEMDLVTRQHRESGKVPIIFAAIDASCQASSNKSAESAVRPALAVQEANETSCDVEECVAIEIFCSFPSVHFITEQSSSPIFLFDLTARPS